MKKLPIGGGAAAAAAGAARADVVGDAVRAVAAAEAAAGPGAVAVGASSERFLGGAWDGRVVRPNGNSGRSESCRPVRGVGRVSSKSRRLLRGSVENARWCGCWHRRERRVEAGIVASDIGNIL